MATSLVIEVIIVKENRSVLDRGVAPLATTCPSPRCPPPPPPPPRPRGPRASPRASPCPAPAAPKK